MRSIDNEMKYFGPAENWFWVVRCDEEGRKPDVCRVLMWVTVDGRIVGVMNDGSKPGWLCEPFFMGAYKHLDDLAPDEREILAEARRIQDVDEANISKGAWLNYCRFEVINDHENTVAEFQKLGEAEDHFRDETQIARKLRKSEVPIKLVAVIRTGNPGMLDELAEAVVATMGEKDSALPQAGMPGGQGSAGSRTRSGAPAQPARAPNG